MCRRFAFLAAFFVLLLPLASVTQEVEKARFHHVHLNVTNPEKTIEFYRTILSAEPIKFRGLSDALYMGRAFILMNKVDAAPPAWPTTALWHIGWGGVDMKSEYKWLQSQNVDIVVPLYPLGRGFVTYIRDPDEAWIEVNTQGHHRFSHVHMFASDVNVTAKWFGDHLGMPPRRTAEENPRPVGPDAKFKTWAEFHAAGNRAWSNGVRTDEVNIAIYNLPNYDTPPWWPFEPVMEFDPQKGHAFDHIAFSYRDIEPVFERMKAAGLKSLDPIRTREAFGIKSFFVQAPDKLHVEIVEAKPIPEGIWE